MEDWIDLLRQHYDNAPYRRIKGKDGDKLYDLIVNDGSICHDCAREKGAVWPKGHQATCWTGPCYICEKETACCAASDWNWPEHKGPRARREF